MGNICLQLATTQHCWVASWKALLEVLPLTSNIVTQQHFKLKKLLKNVDGSSTYCDVLQLATTKFVPWQCLRWVHEVIRATTLFNLQRNSNVVLQVAAICCSYYFTFQYRTDNFSLLTLSRLSASTVLNTSTRSACCSVVWRLSKYSYFRRTGSCKFLSSLPIESPPASVSFTRAFAVFRPLYF